MAGDKVCLEWDPMVHINLAESALVQSLNSSKAKSLSFVGYFLFAFVSDVSALDAQWAPALHQPH